MRSCPACKSRVLTPRHFLQSRPRCPSCNAVVGPKLSVVILGMILLVTANTFASKVVGSSFALKFASTVLVVLLFCTLAYFFAPLEVFPEPPPPSPSTRMQRIYAAIALTVVIGFIVWLFVLNVAHGG